MDQPDLISQCVYCLLHAGMFQCNGGRGEAAPNNTELNTVRT